jgi:hypothetical protein
MQTWSLVACGWLPEDARDEFAQRVGTLLAEPKFGCDHTSLVIGQWPAVRDLHTPAERAREPAPA